MTIAAGFPCKDGLVICADTQETIPGLIKSGTEKITQFGMPNYNVVFTGAGDGELLGALIDKMMYGLIDKKPVGALEVRNVLEDRLLSFFKEQISTNHFITDEQVVPDMLVGLQYDGGTFLYQCRGTFVRWLRSPYVVGTGVLFARSRIAELYDKNVNLKEAGLIALYILHEAKQWVDGCGGNSDIFLLSNAGKEITHIATEDVRSLENHFDSFSKAVKPLLISCANSEVSETTFDGLMKNFTLDMLGLRGKFMKSESFWVKLREMTGFDPDRPDLNNP